VLNVGMKRLKTIHKEIARLFTRVTK